MRHSISKKLFLITFGIILFLIAFTMLFQVFFFQKFYLDRKSSNLQEGVKKFKSMYSFDINNKARLSKALGNFEKEYNAKMVIYSTDGSVKYLSDPDNSNGELIDRLNQIFNELYYDPAYTKALLDSNTVITTLFDSKEFSSKHLVCMAPFSLSSNRDSIIIAITSFQPIEEASSVIKDFYKYILVVVLFLGLILSYVYSDLIAKPLIKINNTAKKLSAMDFSEKCVVNRDDEIGSLAETLNFLSQNLHNALEDLKIKNEKLQQDIEKERKLEKLRKDFIAGVSHELKTPIGIISGYAEGLKDGIVDNESKDIYLDIIIDESIKMNKLVMDMLELSKLESGKIDLNLTNFSLKYLTEDILTKNSVDIFNNNLNLINLINEEDDFMVNGDEFKIDQVITNIITNAIKYTPKGCNIIVDIKKVNDEFTLSIENTGAHIVEDELDKIWNQFYRGDTSRNRSSRSTGLGLSIVKNLLQLHNSNFGVYNTEKGVKFYFSLKKATKTI